MLTYKTMRVNGYDMAYVERGAGVPVILVHGALSDYRYWTSQMRPFGESYHAIAVSLRHCYPERWSGEGDGHSLKQHQEDLVSFINRLNEGPVHLVGHSRGADLAAFLVSARPDLVRKLVLVEPAPINTLMRDIPDARDREDEFRVLFSAALAALERGDREGALKQFVEGVNYPGAWERVPGRQKENFRDNAWSLKSLQVDADEPFSCRDAGKFNAPVLLVTGEKSAPIYKLMAEALQKCFTQHETVTIAKASHPVNQMNPDAFNTAVLEFLQND